MNSDDRRDEQVPLLLQYWQAVSRYRIGIACIVLGTIALGIIVTLLMTPYYTATSRIEINRNQDKVTNVEGLEAEDVGQNLEFYQTQYALLEARSLADRVVRSENLATGDAFFQTFNVDPDENGIISGSDSRQSSEDRRRRFELAIRLLLDNVSISPVRGSSLVDVSFRSPDPQLSASIANAWVAQFVDSNLDRRFDSTIDARKFLEERLAQLRARLEDSERRLVRYADNKEIVTLSTTRDAEGSTVGGDTLISSNLAALNKALTDATADRIAAQAQADQNGLNKDAIENPAINGMRQKRAEIASEYAKILVQFEPEYPTAKALERQISDLDESIEKEELRMRTGALTRYSEALKRERNLQNQVAQLKSKFSGERQDTIQYNIFQREVDTNRQLYNGLLQRYKEIGVAGVGSNNIAVVDPALAPEQPSSPRILLNMALAMLMGLGLAGAYVVVSEQIDQTIKDPSDLKNRLNLAPLGSVPDMRKDDIISMLQDKKSVAWEAYISIQTSLSFLTSHGAPRSFLMTSTRPNEGKSTSAFALAAVLSSTNRKVLLIDGDMRNPSLHQMIDQKNVQGLSNYLSGDDDIDNLIQKMPDQGFWVMTAGPIPPNAAELLSSPRIKKLFDHLEEKFDCVIVDAPPVLGLADIPLLANAVEGVIYTIEAGGVKVRGIESALRRVRSSHATIFGAIITKVKSSGTGYGYGYDYQYSYGQQDPLPAPSA
ncbi:GumC family protein [Parasphingorhabdus marina]|uniref:GumC family protein n=1 Tax=Parasphingorhabdus marina TaxID=394732 RepID=UPI001951C47F|nr:polysaccharide biosynthesis tyrosine autokinase [Parasphingorhabdus marina]